ncbi:hypothetical protein ADL29_03400 [Streptomyces chattanoogensis]|uniref:Uncharacterized protein n=1 Tax=Streptomyces chattanoogensis TaxID=66876 RepID=A0A0N1JZC4_9ACTN|nr:hypothetical protein ADL29_03400 [Streptomyces chattanoogensis]
MQQSVFESVRYSAACQGCGAEAEWQGVQALVGDSLRWDVGSTCSACGFAVAVCGRDLPDELRGRLLSEHRPAALQVPLPVQKTKVMRVLRAELSIGLADVKVVLERVLAGAYAGTLPEIERLARRLRAAGVDAMAVRPACV